MPMMGREKDQVKTEAVQLVEAGENKLADMERGLESGVKSAGLEAVFKTSPSVGLDGPLHEPSTMTNGGGLVGGHRGSSC